MCHALWLLSLCCLAWLHFSLVLGEPDSDRVCAQNASEDCPEVGALMQLAADFQPESQPEPRKERTQDTEAPCQTGGMQLHDGAVVVAPCLIEGTPPLKAPILSFEQVMQEAKADADPYKNFCGDLEDSVCKMAYEVIDHGLDLAVGRWKHVALNYGSNGWGSSDMDICEVQTSYVTAKIPSCTTLEKIGGCSACQECCKQAGKRSSCYKALRPMVDRLLESYTHSVKYILSVSVRTVNFLKYMQRVALDYSVDSAYDQVMYQRQQMVKPPPAKPSMAAAMGRLFLEAMVSFTHSASASFNFFKGGYKGQALDYLAALIRLCEKVVVPILKENSEFAGAVLGHVRNMMCETWSKCCDWRCQVTFAKDSIRMYYLVVFDNLVATMKQRIAQVVASSWARGKMADQHLSLEEVMQKDYHGVLGPIMGKDGFCIERSDSGGVKSDTFIFQITDATVQYQTFQALMPVSYRVCAENMHMCTHAPMERISHDHISPQTFTNYASRYDCQTGCAPAACFFSRAKATGPVLFGPGETVPGWSTTSTTSLSLDVAMERRATAATGKSTLTEETSLDSAIVGKSPCDGGRTKCRGDGQGNQYCYPNHETCDSYCPNSDADPGPTDKCDLMRTWTDLRSFESFELGGGSYSAWLCGWESDDDMSKIWMPNSNLMATIDRLVRIRTENHTQSLGEMLNPYIQGLTRWRSTIPSGWAFEIMRLPRSRFINSDDGKMMIYTQQIGQNCNWYKDSGGCAGYDEFIHGEYKGRCGNEPWINEHCGTEAHAPSLPVRSCETYTSPTDYCNKWCNTGRGGCGIETFNDDTCDCSGCNGCPVCETVVVGPHQGSSTFVRANLTNSSFKCPQKVDKQNWLNGDLVDDRFEVSKEVHGEVTQVVVQRIESDSRTWMVNLAFQCCEKLARLCWA